MQDLLFEPMEMVFRLEPDRYAGVSNTLSPSADFAAGDVLVVEPPVFPFNYLALFVEYVPWSLLDIDVWREYWVVAHYVFLMSPIIALLALSASLLFLMVSPMASHARGCAQGCLILCESNGLTRRAASRTNPKQQGLSRAQYEAQFTDQFDANTVGPGRGASLTGMPSALQAAS